MCTEHKSACFIPNIFLSGIHINEMYAETHTGFQIKSKQLLPDFKQNKKWSQFKKLPIIKFNVNLFCSYQDVTSGQTD